MKQGRLEEISLRRGECVYPRGLVKGNFWGRVKALAGGWCAEKGSERALFELLWSRWRRHGRRNGRSRFPFNVHFGQVDAASMEPPKRRSGQGA